MAIDYRKAIAAARGEGYSDDEIVQHLAGSDPKVRAAVAEGYTAAEIVDFLRRKNLSSVDKGLMDSVKMTPEEKAHSAKVEAMPAVAAELDAAIANATDPKIRATLIAEREQRNQTSAPRAGASQADVRASEPSAAAVKAASPDRSLEALQAKRAEIDKQLDDLRKTIQAQEEAPAEFRNDDMIASLRAEQKRLTELRDRTGVSSTGRTIGGIVGGVLGGIGGGVLGAPSGPGAVAGGIAGSAAGTGLGSAIGSWFDLQRAKANAQEITPEEASQHILSGAVEDVLWDVGGSVLFFVGGKVLKMAASPALRKRLQQEVLDAATDKRAGVAVRQRAEAVDRFFDPSRRGTTAAEDVMAADAREKAVRELSARTEGRLPTAGQMGERPSFFGEQVPRALHKDVFRESDEAFHRATGDMRTELLRPTGAPSRRELGATVQRITNDTIEAIRQRTGPIFERAAQANVRVDVQPSIDVIEQTLAADARSAGGLLKPGERTFLEQRLDAMRGMLVTGMEADGAQNLVSALKAKGREMTVEGEPSKHFRDLLNGLTQQLDDDFRAAVGRADPALRAELMSARDQYAQMNRIAFSDAMSDALKKASTPEDVGRIFYQQGNVSEIEQLQNALALARREKRLTPEGEREIWQSMTRGFIQDAVPDVATAAKWTEKLRANQRLNDTWQALINRPGMSQLDEGMRVLEQAAKIAEKRNADLAMSGSGYVGNLPQRALVGLTLGYMGIPGASLIMSADVLARMMATALATGNKGIYRDIQMLLRAGQVTKPRAAGEQAVRAAIARVSQWAGSNGFNQPQEEQ